MNFSRSISLTLCACCIVGAALIAPDTEAKPCVIEKNKWGFWVGDCLLSKEVLIDGVFIPRPPLFMPDLYADDGDFLVQGTRVEIEVRTGNLGSIVSRDFDVTADVTVTGGGMAPQTFSITGRVNGQPAGTRTRTTLGYVLIPDRINDYDLETVFTVDSSDFANGGEIRESDETNNIFNDGICRVYGENPDVSVGPCD
jgi:hypothetical protein